MMKQWAVSISVFAAISAACVDVEVDDRAREEAALRITGTNELVTTPTCPEDAIVSRFVSDTGSEVEFCVFDDVIVVVEGGLLAGGGDVEWIEERCSESEDYVTGNWDWLGMYWCTSVPVASEQRTMSTQLGTRGTRADTSLASCNGTSRMRMRYRKTSAYSWSTLVDTNVASGYWKNIYASSTYDHDYRFNGNRYGSAWFRSTGYFGDFDWP